MWRYVIGQQETPICGVISGENSKRLPGGAD